MDINMKGLIIKDFKIMSKNSRFMIIMLVIAILILMQTSKDGSFSFIVGYITMIGWLMSINTLAYDDSDKSIVFLMTLPSDRKIYVTEKYILSFICCFIGCMLSTFLLIIIGKQPIADVLPLGISVLAIYSIFSMITIPLRLKMGSERSGVILFVFGIVIFAAVGMFNSIIERISSLNIISVSETKNFILRAADAFSSLSKPLIYAILCLIFVICIALSWLTSMRIMRKREF